MGKSNSRSKPAACECTEFTVHAARFMKLMTLIDGNNTRLSKAEQTFVLLDKDKKGKPYMSRHHIRERIKQWSRQKIW